MTDSLLSRLQSLTEPSREIDAEIALANGWRRCEGNLGCYDIWYSPDLVRTRAFPPAYTESLDAALTLVPADCEDWQINRDSALGLHYWASISGGMTRPGYVGPSPAIALLIAIMKAKEESKP